MSDELGWVKFHRRILNNVIFKDSELFHLFSYCIMRANHEGASFLFNGTEQKLKRGQFITGRNVISKLTGIKTGNVYNKLKILKNLGIINIETNNKFSIITVLKYNTYQSAEPTTSQQTSQQLNNNLTTSSQQDNTNKNNKNKENDNNEKKSEKSAEDVEKIINSVLLKYNSFAILNNLPKCLKVTGDRRANLIDRLQEPEFNIDHILTGVKNSEWLLKKQDPKFNIDFIISSDNNYIKILEGKFNAEKNKTFKNGFNASKNGEAYRRNGNTAGGFGIGTNATGNQQAERKPDIIV